MSWQKQVDDIAAKRSLAQKQGGDEAVARQHEKGHLTIRERIAALIDAGSFAEHGVGAGGAERDEQGNLTGFTPGNYVTGLAKIGGRLAAVGGEDFTVRGGSPNAAGLRKSVYVESLALQFKVPLVRIHEGGGGSVTGSTGKGPVGSPVYEKPRFQTVAQCLESVPVATAGLGPVAGLPASRLVASHFSVMAENAQVMIGGPALVERALGKPITKEELGGPKVHAKSGVIDAVAKNEEAALGLIRQFLSYMPQNVWELPPVLACSDPADRSDDELISIVPADRRQAYDMRKLIRLVVDEGSFFEFGRAYGQPLICGYARLNGHPVALFANDCRFLAGAMTAEAAQKVRRLIEIAETFHLPIVTFVDEPGFMIGPGAETAGAIRYGTSAVLAAAMCENPWATVVVRKNYGVAGAAHYGANAYVLGWPSAEMGALPLEGGVAVAFRRQIQAAEDPAAERARLEAEMAAKLSPNARAESFAMHELIDPRETRPYLCRWIEWSQTPLQQMVGPRRFGIRP
ncbi:MAG TPA: carboxyl transferase domain-containing protein [Alphaproteobacteria bacterium]|nr:carboxyl transferase domain-containing protein [Alphaproteobacteria bacterium]